MIKTLIQGMKMDSAVCISSYYHLAVITRTQVNFTMASVHIKSKFDIKMSTCIIHKLYMDSEGS